MWERLSAVWRLLRSETFLLVTWRVPKHGPGEHNAIAVESPDCAVYDYSGTPCCLRAVAHGLPSIMDQRLTAMGLMRRSGDV